LREAGTSGLINIQHRQGETAPAERLVVDFAERLWSQDRSGPPTLQVFYDPGSLEPDALAGVLDARAIADKRTAFIPRPTSP